MSTVERETTASAARAHQGKVDEFDVVIIGAGFGGLDLTRRMLKLGKSVRVFETASDVGGTWYWNKYPGARCDVESYEYSYGFDEDLQQEWVWSERYAGQAELQRYAAHVADRFDLRRHIQFDTRVARAEWDGADQRWRVTTDEGLEVVSQFLILATGNLSAANKPVFPGAESFTGQTVHTSEWPAAGVDFAGKRVGVIGTGSSGVQAIPIIAEQADELYVFQRTATYVVPSNNRPLTEEDNNEFKAEYAALRAADRKMPGGFGAKLGWAQDSALDATPEERRQRYQSRYDVGGFVYITAFRDTPSNPEANSYAAEFIRSKIREKVKDPAVAELLTPRHTIGCKRLCLDTGYYETFNNESVHLVDVSQAPIEALTPTGLRTGGVDYELDVIVFATGFDAMTGSMTRIDIHGRDGVTLKDAWHAGPVTYLGLGVPKFPNLFIVAGPGSPSVLTNMILSIEQHGEWIEECVAYMAERGLQTIEATEAAADDWVLHVNEVANLTLYPTCNSWYLGSNVPGKVRVFMPLPNFPPYEERCDRVAANDYEGFTLK
jgi:cation diffusion facilitator CzcD-associated flavoprotein CzcO